MPNTKKYVSLDKLSLYDEKIKKVISDDDAAALASAKSYADGLAVNYDAAGAAATALSDAKAYADGKDAAIAAAQKAGDDAAAAALVADGKAVAAQGEVDALEAYVGTFTASEGVDTVVKYIDAKTANIASDETVGAIADRVGVVEGKVTTIEGDYLKAADKTELEGKITAANTAVETEKARAEGVEAGLRTDVDAVKADYLKGADKTELQGNIDDVAGDVADIAADYLKGADKTELNNAIALKADKTYVDEKVEALEAADENLQTQINTIMNNPDTEGVINSINEFTQYIADHGAIADGFRADIDKNKADIAAMDTAYKAADTAMAGRLDALEAIDHEAYIAADTALKNELDADIAELATAVENAKTDASNKDAVVLAEAQKATAAVQTALDEAVESLEGADSAMAGRLDALEAKFTGNDSVADLIATAKQEAIDAAASAADTKDEAVLAAAKKYADDEDAKIESRVDALEAASGTHAMATDLTALAGRVETAEGEIDTLQTEMDAVEALAAAADAAAKANASAIALKASQADLDAVSGRVTAIETWHANFVEVSEEEINGLFA